MFRPGKIPTGVVRIPRRDGLTNIPTQPSNVARDVEDATDTAAATNRPAATTPARNFPDAAWEKAKRIYR